MNITDLVNRELKKAEDKFGKDDAIVSMLRKCLPIFCFSHIKTVTLRSKKCKII